MSSANAPLCQSYTITASTEESKSHMECTKNIAKKKKKKKPPRTTKTLCNRHLGEATKWLALATVLFKMALKKVCIYPSADQGTRSSSPFSLPSSPGVRRCEGGPGIVQAQTRCPSTEGSMGPAARRLPGESLDKHRPLQIPTSNIFQGSTMLLIFKKNFHPEGGKINFTSCSSDINTS